MTLAGVVLVGLVVLFAMPLNVVTIATLVIVSVLARVACAADTLRVAVERPRWAIVLLGWSALVMLGVLADRAANHYRENYVQTFTIPSRSMMDTLLVGDYIVVDRSAYRTQAPRRGDIVVLVAPLDERRTFIYRIIGTPGDVVQMRGAEMLINGKALDEAYVRRDLQAAERGDSCRYAYGCEPLPVPAHSYFVMGDNRDNSRDSRFWGLVKHDRIKGKAREVYWSWDSDQHWLRWWRLGRRIL